MTSTIRRDSAHPSVSARTSFTNETFFDETELAELRAYARPRKRVGTVAKTLGLAIDLLLIFAFDLGPKAADWVSGQGWVIRLAVVMAVFSVISTAVTLPFAYWGVLVHDRKHGVSNQSVGLFFADQAKDLVIGIVLSVALLTPVLAAIHSFDNWWLIGGVAFLSLQLILVFVYPVAIMPRFNKFTPMEDGPVRARIEEIADMAGVTIEGVYTMDGSKRSRRGNAFVAGFGPTKRVVVYDTVMDFPLEQLAQIIAHEIGHYRLKHITQSFPVAAVQILAALAFVQAVGTNETILGWAGVDDLGDPAAFPLFGVAFGIPMTLFALVSAWLSRRHEREADLEALELLGDPTNFVGMWPRLVALNKADLEPGFWDKLNASHPETAERMQFGLDWANLNGVEAAMPEKSSVPPPSAAADSADS